jgi:hypothetical protein
MPKERAKEETGRTKTAWTSEDEDLLVYTLLDEKRKGNWGDNNPKKQAWVACEAALAGSEEATKSSHKDVSSIKSCWQRVSALRNVEYMHVHSWIYAAQTNI